MDSLLEKLRAAAPQARDQRDRRRRARLKERHQVRIASGQQIPDIPVKDRDGNIIDDDSDGHHGMLSPESVPEEGAGSADSSNHGDTAQVSESEDVADRAASMLQGLRGDGADGDSVDRDSSIRVRRRRESADDERKSRRLRRRTAQASSSQDGSLPPVKERDSTIVEDDGNKPVTDVGEEAMVNGHREELDKEKEELPTPTIVVSPTTEAAGDGTVGKPLEIPD